MAEGVEREKGRPGGLFPSLLLALISLAVGAGLIWYAYASLDLDKLRSGIKWAEGGAWTVAGVGTVLCIVLPAWLLLRRGPADDAGTAGRPQRRQWALGALGTLAGLLVVGQFVYFLWPGADIRRDARLDNFEPDLEDYSAALAAAGPAAEGVDFAETEGYVAGKVLILRTAEGDEPDYDNDALVDEGLTGDEAAGEPPGSSAAEGGSTELELDNLYFDLPEDLQASEPKEVGTLAVIEWHHSTGATYEGGSAAIQAAARLLLIDLGSGDLVAVETIEGPEPDAPETRGCAGSGGCDNILGGLPDDELIEHIESLRRQSAGS